MNPDDALDAPMEAQHRREDEFHDAVERYVADHRDELLIVLHNDVGSAELFVMSKPERDKALFDLAEPIVDRLFSEPVERDDD